MRRNLPAGGLSIQVKETLKCLYGIWHYGEEIHDLKGTARTLDMVNGATGWSTVFFPGSDIRWWTTAGHRCFAGRLDRAKKKGIKDL